MLQKSFKIADIMMVVFDPSWNTDQGVLELRKCSGFPKPITRSESEIF
jgi:hypothetical protein